MIIVFYKEAEFDGCDWWSFESETDMLIECDFIGRYVTHWAYEGG